jgi:hypothetical protein
MDLHKPKPWHGVREFLKEYLIIVIGVLTALGAEQAVTSLHEHRATAEAREAVRDEIASDLGWMILRQTRAQGCLDRRLDELSGVMAAAREGRAYPTAQWVGRALNQPVSSRRWIAASQSGRLSLLPSREQAAYADFYFVLENYAAAETAEQATWATLRSLEGMRTVPPAMLWGFTDALAQARLENYHAKRTTTRALDNAKALGIRPSVRRGTASDVKLEPTCVPIGTDRARAIAMIGNPTGEP